MAPRRKSCNRLVEAGMSVEFIRAADRQRVLIHGVVQSIAEHFAVPGLANSPDTLCEVFGGALKAGQPVPGA